MTQTWQSVDPPDYPKTTAVGWILALLRAVPLAVLVFGGLALLLVVRLIELPFFGLHRPITPYITQGVCRGALWLLGIRFRVTGRPMIERGAIVANHSSWLDIFSLNAAKRIYFVSKSEVAGWPGIGWLARATGTVFLERKRAHARRHTEMFQERLLAGHKLLFFPEGTSTDGLQVLPFKTTLFEAFYADGIRDVISVQPVSVVYHAPPGAEHRFYGWWGDTSFGAHLLVTLAPVRQGAIDVMYHPPLQVAAHADRKALARACEEAVRAGHAKLQIGSDHLA
ncbi:MAG: lysophospholipid acyltransferase family protein [Sulfitobacter sp.]